jgi:hypothetical protein
MTSPLHSTVALVLLVSISGCARTESSPAQYLLDIRVAPGFAVGEGLVTFHPTVAYARSMFGGEDGEHGTYLFLGGQARFAAVSASPAGSGLWLGGEATFARRRTTFDDPASDVETQNGWTIAALVGLPVLEGAAGTIHGYAAAGVNKYGGTGSYLRVGADLQPAFLRR